MTLKRDKFHDISQMRMTCESNFASLIRVTMAAVRQAQQRPGVPEELVKDVRIELYKNGEIVKTVEVKDNYQRLCRVDVAAVEADSVAITPLSTNGASQAVIHEVRIYGRKPEV